MIEVAVEGLKVGAAVGREGRRLAPFNDNDEVVVAVVVVDVDVVNDEDGLCRDSC